MTFEKRRDSNFPEMKIHDRPEGKTKKGRISYCRIFFVYGDILSQNIKAETIILS